ncbi:MAG TPA: GPW/gp25 family protein [Casimicrobiaceae bacterium]|nr:GPW/gp25 family protein [Casimicrobiaceae bacterium]
MAVGTPGALPQPPSQASYLGQGIAYPLAYDANGRLELSAGTKCVDDSMSSIMQTQPGERVMQPDYGADDVTFEPVTDVGRRKARLEQVIADHEPRVTSVDVTAQLGQDGNEQAINVEYTIAGQATPQTLVFPSYTGPAMPPNQ